MATLPRNRGKVGTGGVGRPLTGQGDNNENVALGDYREVGGDASCPLTGQGVNYDSVAGGDYYWGLDLSMDEGRLPESSRKKSRLRMTDIRDRRAVSMECFWKRRYTFERSQLSLRANHDTLRS